MTRALKSVTAGLLAIAVSASTCGEEFAPEFAFSEVLPENNGQEWFWAYGSPGAGDGQAYLYDENGKRLGQLSTGYWFNNLTNAKKRDEIITVETYFSRGTRGQRVDIVSTYDTGTLSYKEEVILPPKRMHSVKSNGLLNLTEDERFALVVNYTPAQSISIVDLDSNDLVEEVETPGCSVLYPAGDRVFYSICGNGSFMQIKLGADGRVIHRQRSDKLFDSVEDFLTISASRVGNIWYFVSRQYNVYAIKMKGDTIELVNKWSLINDEERADNWSIAGMNHTAAHGSTGKLYVLMHQGEPHQFEEPGTHVWVYDAKSGEKVDEIELTEIAMSIAISQDETPQLYAVSIHFPMPALFVAWIFLVDGEAEVTKAARQRINVYDATSGELKFSTALIPSNSFIQSVQPW